MGCWVAPKKTILGLDKLDESDKKCLGQFSSLWVASEAVHADITGYRLAQGSAPYYETEPIRKNTAAARTTGLGILSSASGPDGASGAVQGDCPTDCPRAPLTGCLHPKERQDRIRSWVRWYKNPGSRVEYSIFKDLGTEPLARMPVLPVLVASLVEGPFGAEL